jgi:transcriptional regulator GlxA family with amidase domain
MVVFLKRPGNQSQFSAHLVGQMSESTMIQRAQDYILENLAAPLTVEGLARQVGMSSRNFARVFRREIGLTPAEFVAAARTDAARRLLEDSAMPLQRIAAACGFHDVNGMRRTFARVLGVSPTEYRRRFDSPAGANGAKRPQQVNEVMHYPCV